MKKHVSRWRRAWLDLNQDERASAYAWLSFTGTLGVTRAITHLIRNTQGSGGSGGIVIAGKHLHHYNLGIAALSGVGALAIRRDRPLWTNPVGPLLYGAANALIVDEAALLLNLKDVYWARQGRVSVDLAVTGIGAGAVAVTAVPFARALRRHDAAHDAADADQTR